MPAAVVHTKPEERHWDEAKARVREEYPDVAEGSDRFYALTMGIYKNMTGMAKSGPLPPEVRAAVVRHIRRDHLAQALATPRFVLRLRK
jgi:hypothetical protein